MLGNDPSSAKVTLTCVATNTDALAVSREHAENIESAIKDIGAKNFFY